MAPEDGIRFGAAATECILRGFDVDDAGTNAGSDGQPVTSISDLAEGEFGPPKVSIPAAERTRPDQSLRCLHVEDSLRRPGQFIGTIDFEVLAPNIAAHRGRRRIFFDLAGRNLCSQWRDTEKEAKGKSNSATHGSPPLEWDFSGKEDGTAQANSLGRWSCERERENERCALRDERAPEL